MPYPNKTNVCVFPYRYVSYLLTPYIVNAHIVYIQIKRKI